MTDDRIRELAIEIDAEFGFGRGHVSGIAAVIRRAVDEAVAERRPAQLVVTWPWSEGQGETVLPCGLDDGVEATVTFGRDDSVEVRVGGRLLYRRGKEGA